MSSPIPEKIGRFEITKVLGQGGMGVVYLGRDPGTEREVAVKTVKVDAPEDIKKRLRIEGTAGRLDHENIVTVYETGEWNGDVPYIAMQFVAGQSLDKLIGSREQLTLLEKLDTIRQVCDGLDYAHLNGVVHRDIKPGNVIRRNDGLVKIVDFGIARVQKDGATSAMTGPLQVIGTLAYMAPERLRGERGDGRVDIFATGVLLYYVLTGEEPFTGEASSVMHKLVSEPHPLLSQRLAGYPPALDQILDRALAKYPEDRYSTAQEFAADLAAVIDELNRGRIAGLLEDCKRLIEEGTFRAAADRAQQVLRIDPQNSAARELRRQAQRGLDRKAIEERLQELQAEAAEALAQKRYDDAIRALEEASRRAPGDEALQERLQDAREKKRLQMLKDTLCSEARTAQSGGDLTGAMQRLKKAVELDPDDVPLLEELSAVERVIREQEERERAGRLISNARREIGARHYTAAIEMLEDLLKSKVSNPDLDVLYRQALEGRKNQDTERRRDQVITQVRKLRIDGKYSDALSEIDHAPDELRSDTMLLRLKRELERDAENSRLAGWIAETVDRVVKEALTSLDGALSTLRESMQKLPGEDRFESLEADLLRRKQEFSNQQRRTTCLREAGEALQAGEPERAIKLIEYYLLEFKADAEIDGLLQDARQEMEAQRLRVRLTEYTAKGRTLLEESRFTQAIAYLKPLVEETQNRGLATLLGQAEQGKTEADGRVRLVAKRVAELRHEGKLGEAVALIESQPAGMLQSSLLQEVLPKLREEQEKLRDKQKREQEKLLEEQRRQKEEQKRNEDKQREEASRKQAFEGALAKMRALVADGDWQRAREPLENMQRVYGNSDALGRAMAAFDHDRSETADRRVGQSVQEAKAALVTADTKSARQALDQAAGFIAFASTGLVEEWRRLEKLPNAKITRVDERRPAARTEQESKSKLRLVLGAGATVVVAAGLLVWHPWKKAESSNQEIAGKTTPASPPLTQAPTEPSPHPADKPSPLPQTQPELPVPNQPKAQNQPPPIPSKPVAPLPLNQPSTKPPPVAQPKPQTPTLLPSVVSFGAEKSSVLLGGSTTLHWEVNNVDSVEIQPGIGKQYPKGSYNIIPSSTTHYRLLASNGTLLKDFEVAVVAPQPATPVVSVPQPVAKPAETPAAKPAGPERSVLLTAVATFQSVIQLALSKKDKECKLNLNAANAGLLASYCGNADKVELNEQGCEVASSSEESAKLTCNENLRYHIIGGDTGSLPAKISFQFSKIPGTGAWRVIKWDRHG